jgi:hypothetical protein
MAFWYKKICLCMGLSLNSRSRSFLLSIHTENDPCISSSPWSHRSPYRKQTVLYKIKSGELPSLLPSLVLEDRLFYKMVGQVYSNRGTNMLLAVLHTTLAMVFIYFWYKPTAAKLTSLHISDFMQSVLVVFNISEYAAIKAAHMNTHVFSLLMTFLKKNIYFQTTFYKPIF